jgi:hypothetical protein
MKILAALNKKERIGVVLSLVWLLASIAFAIDDARKINYDYDGRYYIEIGEFIYNFIFYGVLPVIVLWGIYWIKKTPN